MAKFIRRGVRTIQILSIIGLALPLCALIGLYLSININLVEKLPIPDLIGKLNHDANLRDGIETGNDPEQLKQLYINMMDKSAIAADATIAEKLNNRSEERRVGKGGCGRWGCREGADSWQRKKIRRSVY